VDLLARLEHFVPVAVVIVNAVLLPSKVSFNVIVPGELRVR